MTEQDRRDRFVETEPNVFITVNPKPESEDDDEEADDDDEEQQREQ